MNQAPYTGIKPCEGSTQDSLQDKTSVLELGASSFQGKFGLHSQTQGWKGALSEGHGETSGMSVRALLKVAQRPLALLSVAPGDTPRAKSRPQCSWKGMFRAGPLQHPLSKASCNIHLKQIREKEG